ncbi:MAG TPA: cyclase family protein [Gammaproteobacteria bacterium]|nr:cyclase family protein [Gammaproteobacteria bacterium]
MKMTLDLGSHRVQVDLTRGADISIPYSFDTPQPRAFGAPPARAETFVAGSFIGDTRRGGSCNVGVYHLVPHCNGTHTECVGHITDDPVFIAEHTGGKFLLATVVSVTPEAASTTHETSDPPPQRDDFLVTARVLEEPIARLGCSFVQALVIRTLPNPPEKATRGHDGASMPPYLTLEAVRLLRGIGVEHLLVDLPSIDRLVDQGRMAAHRVFWGLEPGSRDAKRANRAHCTITEFVYVPDAVPDGHYVLDLQVPRFLTDAAPSRPILFPAELL